jgi:NADPH:quinone reductase-like Zn-dependent oxidoreductase
VSCCSTASARCRKRRSAHASVTGGAGGVGSILIQLAPVTGLTVLATATRPQSQQW